MEIWNEILVGVIAAIPGSLLGWAALRTAKATVMASVSEDEHKDRSDAIALMGEYRNQFALLKGELANIRKDKAALERRVFALEKDNAIFKAKIEECEAGRTESDLGITILTRQLTENGISPRYIRAEK
jgi:hypothetical protein